MTQEKISLHQKNKDFMGQTTRNLNCSITGDSNIHYKGK